MTLKVWSGRPGERFKRDRDAERTMRRRRPPASFGARVAMASLMVQVAQALCGPCRRCGCTNKNCAGCVARTGAPCHWIAPDLCSACGGEMG